MKKKKKSNQSQTSKLKCLGTRNLEHPDEKNSTYHIIGKFTLDE